MAENSAIESIYSPIPRVQSFAEPVYVPGPVMQQQESSALPQKRGKWSRNKGIAIFIVGAVLWTLIMILLSEVIFINILVSPNAIRAFMSVVSICGLAAAGLIVYMRTDTSEKQQ